MSGSLMPLGDGGNALSRSTRRTAMAIQRGHLHGELRIAAADVETAVTQAKIEDLTIACGSGMQAVVRVAQAQAQLEQLAPAASGLLAALATTHALAMSDAINDLRAELRRK